MRVYHTAVLAQELSRSQSAEGLAKTMTAVIVAVFEAAGLTVSEKKTETRLLRTPDQTILAPPLAVEAAGQRY